MSDPNGERMFAVGEAVAGAKVIGVVASYRRRSTLRRRKSGLRRGLNSSRGRVYLLQCSACGRTFNSGKKEINRSLRGGWPACRFCSGRLGPCDKCGALATDMRGDAKGCDLHPPV